MKQSRFNIRTFLLFILHLFIFLFSSLTGINIPATVALAQALKIPVIASGGLSNMADIEALCEVEDEGVEGVICGRAIYTGDLDFAAGQARADELNG